MADLSSQQFAGHNYEDKIEWVPTDEAWKYREYDRETEPAWSGTHLDELTSDIAENGIKSPLILTYGHRDRRAYFGEGNHRLAAARRLGLPEVPVRVWRMSTEAGRGPKVPGYQEEGHVPADLRPSQIGIRGARK